MPEYPIHGSKWFDVREWVDPRTWELLGERAAMLIDPKMIAVANLLREISDAPTKVNTWHYAGRGERPYISSGFRAVWDKTGGALSQHRCGRAGDFKVSGYSSRLLLTLIERNKSAFLDAGLTTIERLEFTPTWLHLDVRPRLSGFHSDDDFLFVSP